MNDMTKTLSLLLMACFGASVSATPVYTVFTASPDPNTSDAIAPWTDVVDVTGDFFIGLNNEFRGGADSGDKTIGDVTFQGRNWSGASDAGLGGSITSNSKTSTNLGTSVDSESMSFVVSSYRHYRESYALTIPGLTVGQEYKYQVFWGQAGRVRAETFTIEGVDVKPDPLAEFDTRAPGFTDDDDAIEEGLMLSGTFIAADTVFDLFMEFDSNNNALSGISGLTLEIVPEPGSLLLLTASGLLMARRPCRAM